MQYLSSAFIWSISELDFPPSLMLFWRLLKNLDQVFTKRPALHVVLGWHQTAYLLRCSLLFAKQFCHARLFFHHLRQVQDFAPELMPNFSVSLNSKTYITILSFCIMFPNFSPSILLFQTPNFSFHSRLLVLLSFHGDANKHGLATLNFLGK